MKKKNIIIIGATIIIVIIIGLFFLTGRERTDVYLKDYKLSNDGATMTLKIGISSSNGYVRKMKRTSGSMNYYFTFYSTFGINSKIGAKDTFEIEIDKDADEIYFSTGNKGYKKVLEKTKDGKWEKVYDSSEDALLSCIEERLGGYIVSEKDEMKPLALKHISNNKEKITYFKGNYTDTTDNMYAVVIGKDKVFDAEVLNDFDNYFLAKYPIYQKYLIGYEGITIYAHNKAGDIDFEEITNKCIPIPKEDGKNIAQNVLDKINDSNKIVIKIGNKELRTIKDQETITEILDIISNSKQYDGNFFSTDSHSFDFEIYRNNELIDVIYAWHDGKRLTPKSLAQEGYYSTAVDLRKLIEEKTDYIFYNIIDISDKCNEKEELLYQDDKYEYYLNCNSKDNLLIEFSLTNKTMTLKYALDNNYIDIERVYQDYQDVLIRKDK